MSGLVPLLALHVTFLADTQVYLGGVSQGNQNDSAPPADLTGSAALVGYNHSVSTNMSGGVLSASIGVMHMTVGTEVQSASGDGNENTADASASAYFHDATIPTSDLSIVFDPVFVGSMSTLDASASGSFVLDDVTAAPFTTLARQDVALNGALPHAQTLDLVGGHTYELEVSAQVGAYGDAFTGFKINAMADLSNTVGVVIQQLDGLGAVVPGNPDLTFASGYDYSVSPACFAAGTRIATPIGEVVVERLAVGDLIVTTSGRLRPVRWIGFRRVEPAHHPRPHEVLPVQIDADAFATGAPHRSLRLSPDHAVYWRGALIPVRYLCNGTTIRQVAAASIFYYHLALDAHDIVLAEGLAVESYLDTGNRDAFASGGATTRMQADEPAAIQKMCDANPSLG